MSDPRPARESLDAIRENLRRHEPPVQLHDFDPQEVARETLAKQREFQWVQTMPARFNWTRLDQPDAPYAAHVDELSEWARAPGGRNLVLFGPTGTAKTSAAMAACHDLYVNGSSVEFWPLIDLLDALRPNGDPYAMNSLREPDVLIIDDLGSEKPSDWTWERLYALVNHRWMHEKPTVATGNQAFEKIKESMDERLWSRLVGNDAVVLRLSGADKRRAAR